MRSTSWNFILTLAVILPRNKLGNSKNLVLLTLWLLNPVAKGANIELVDTGYYEKMCFDILRNEDWYRAVPDSFNVQVKYHSTVNRAFNKGIIDKYTLEFLTVKFPKLSTFYALPKTHKNLSRPHGRPIVSGNSNLNQQASLLIGT